MSKTPEEHVGARIRRHRLAKGVSQVDLAKRIGVKPPSLCDWESGRANPMVSNVEAAAAALGLTMGELYGDASEEPTEAAG